MTSAVVVGSGPNGLAAAIVLAGAGVSTTIVEAAERLGGGCRSSELTLPGLVHDDCSAFHPTGAASPFFRSLPLERHGLTWLWPEIQMAHPLDGDRVAVLLQSVDDTAERLGADGARWRKLFGPLVERFDDLADGVFGPVVRVPSHPLLMARFGLSAIRSVTSLVRRFDTDEAKVLFAGVAAHIMAPLNRPLSAAAGLVLTTAGHAHGWPVARGGSGAIVDALAAHFTELGGVVRTGEKITSRTQLDGADIVIYDLAPGAVEQILGDRLPNRVARAYRRYRHGGAAFKLDLAVEGSIPWRSEELHRAGTVHIGGGIAEMIEAERTVHRGSMPERPFVLVGQQSTIDPDRSRDGIHPIWTYAHVPHGCADNVSEAIIDQIERYAPGVRSRIVARFTRPPAALEAYNPNFVGGDIANGASAGLQLVFRPRIGLDPYATGVPGHYLASAATPPGAGVHGMSGYHAATSALRHVD